MNTQLTEAEYLIYSLLGRNEEYVQLWWNSPNKAFDDKTPLSVWNLNPECVLKYLRTMAAGGYI